MMVYKIADIKNKAKTNNRLLSYLKKKIYVITRLSKLYLPDKHKFTFHELDQLIIMICVLKMFNYKDRYNRYMDANARRYNTSSSSIHLFSEFFTLEIIITGKTKEINIIYNKTDEHKCYNMYLDDEIDDTKYNLSKNKILKMVNEILIDCFNSIINEIYWRD